MSSNIPARDEAEWSASCSAIWVDGASESTLLMMDTYHVAPIQAIATPGDTLSRFGLSGLNRADGSLDQKVDGPVNESRIIVFEPLPVLKQSIK